MTEREVFVLQKRIALSYEWFEVTEARVEEWHTHLAQHDAEAVNAMLNAYIANGRRVAPSVAELVPQDDKLNPAILAGDTSIRQVEEWERNAVPPPPEILTMVKAHQDRKRGRKRV